MPRKHKPSTLHYIPTTDVDLKLRTAIEQILIDECERCGIGPAEATRLVLAAGQQIFALITKQ
jgi:hypothetical protein